MDLKLKKLIISLLTIMLLISIGTLVYNKLEKWSYIDSFYFSTTTLLTIGYGDLHPTTDISKLFTVLYVLTCVSAVLYELSIIKEYHYPPLKNSLRKTIDKIKK